MTEHGKRREAGQVTAGRGVPPLPRCCRLRAHSFILASLAGARQALPAMELMSEDFGLHEASPTERRPAKVE